MEFERKTIKVTVKYRAYTGGMVKTFKGSYSTEEEAKEHGEIVEKEYILPICPNCGSDDVYFETLLLRGELVPCANCASCAETFETV